MQDLKQRDILTTWFDDLHGIRTTLEITIISNIFSTGFLGDEESDVAVVVVHILVLIVVVVDQSLEQRV